MTDRVCRTTEHACSPLRRPGRWPRPAVALAVAALAISGISAAWPSAAAARTRLESTTARDTRLVGAIDAGEVHTCTVRNDGSVRCWGGNGHGQLGDGTTSDRLEPVNVSNLARAVMVSAGRAHACALRVDGKVRCWGANASGQLGDDTLSERKTPVTVKNLSDAVEVAAGGAHSCALLHNGTVRCWGENGNGQLGDGTTTDRKTPVTVTSSDGTPLDRVTAIAAGVDHTCALRADSTVRCWGRNAFGQLGDGSTTRRPRPVTVRDSSGTPVSGFVTISASDHTCAAHAAGTVLCWGLNADSQIDQSTTNHRNPVLLSGFGGVNFTDAVTVVAGGAHTCALRAIGQAFCVGSDAFGQLGDGSLANVMAVTAGGAHTCALQADGAPRCWGLGVVGQLGNGTIESSSAPSVVTDISPDAPEVLAVSGRDIVAGGNHTCAVRATGAVACWGSNAFGQTGDQFTVGGSSSFPETVLGLQNVQALAAGHDHTCALRGDFVAVCWGRNGSGQLGDGTTDGRAAPEPVSGLARPIALAAGNFFTCAIVDRGLVRCWGANQLGQLGDGTTGGFSTVPRVVDAGARAVALAGGSAHTCALLVGGTVSCWGFNALGQLGDGTVSNNRPTPGPVTGLTDVVAIASGFVHTCALRADGTVWCWGDNGFGALGDGTRTGRPAPVQVTNLTGVMAIAAGSMHTCALKADGSVRCWGDNRSGQLGDGSTATRLVSVRVSGLSDAVAVAAGSLHTCAVRVDGGVFCWGENAAGQVGDGTTTDRLSAREVPSFRANIAGTAALLSNGQRVLVTAVVNCPVNHQITIQVTLVQETVIGQGEETERCWGRLSAYPVEVSVPQGPPFRPGTAHAEVIATVRNGHTVVDTQEWERDVTLVIAP